MKHWINFGRFTLVNTFNVSLNVNRMPLWTFWIELKLKVFQSKCNKSPFEAIDWSKWQQCSICMVNEWVTWNRTQKWNTKHWQCSANTHTHTPHTIVKHMDAKKFCLIKGLLWQLRLNSKSFIVERVVPTKLSYSFSERWTTTYETYTIILLNIQYVL